MFKTISFFIISSIEISFHKSGSRWGNFKTISFFITVHTFLKWDSMAILKIFLFFITGSHLLRGDPIGLSMILQDDTIFILILISPGGKIFSVFHSTGLTINSLKLQHFLVSSQLCICFCFFMFSFLNPFYLFIAKESMRLASLTPWFN